MDTEQSEHCYLFRLNEYQRIAPMRAYYNEYLDWEEYRTTFTKYETDFQYVQYCEELSKKLKWVEAYFTSDKCEEFRNTYWARGHRQAIKIAEAFSSLPMKLAYRAYKEYLINLEQEHRFNNFVRAAFELWKRVIKQQMKLEDALEQTLSETTFYYPRLIECQIKNRSGWMHIIYWNCMAQIPVVEDDKALELITDLVNKKFVRVFCTGCSESAYSPLLPRCLNTTNFLVRLTEEKYLWIMSKRSLRVARRIGLAGECVP